jgi:hypothetical protein
MTSDKTRQQLEELLTLDQDELLIKLVPEHTRAQQAYSRGGLVTRGRDIFHRVSDDVRGAICRQYNQRTGTTKNLVDLAVIIVPALVSVPHLSVPVLPLAALLVKTGLEELCREDKE